MHQWRKHPLWIWSPLNVYTLHCSVPSLYVLVDEDYYSSLAMWRCNFYPNPLLYYFFLRVAFKKGFFSFTACACFFFFFCLKTLSSATRAVTTLQLSKCVTATLQLCMLEHFITECKIHQVNGVCMHSRRNENLRCLHEINHNTFSSPGYFMHLLR